eukprot:scaffold269_cov404-Prasinococcus_capsulatus_cf.AAC.19
MVWSKKNTVRNSISSSIGASKSSSSKPALAMSSDIAASTGAKRVERTPRLASYISAGRIMYVSATCSNSRYMVISVFDVPGAGAGLGAGMGTGVGSGAGVGIGD